MGQAQQGEGRPQGEGIQPGASNQDPSSPECRYLLHRRLAVYDLQYLPPTILKSVHGLSAQEGQLHHWLISLAGLLFSCLLYAPHRRQNQEL